MTQDQKTALGHVLARFPSVALTHKPTRLEQMKNLGAQLNLALYVKRDDCTGIGFGGNKTRQLDYYLGAAVSQGADVVLITGAVQSNFVRTTAAMARQLGLECHIQLEERVSNDSALYRDNGNVLLDKILGATVHSCLTGEDESGADASLYQLAADLAGQGRRPYVIPLSAAHPPIGALGYIEAAVEVKSQIDALGGLDEILIASGSGNTHAGLLFGLRALDVPTRVTGICVRRDGASQHKRIRKRLDDLANLTGMPDPTRAKDINLFDRILAPGYGVLNPETKAAILRTAQSEGLFLDPVYSGKTMAGLIALATGKAFTGKRVLFWHTGGQPALFAYGDQLL